MVDCTGPAKVVDCTGQPKSERSLAIQTVNGTPCSVDKAHCSLKKKYAERGKVVQYICCPCPLA